MNETKYKGKNIRVSDEAHAIAVNHCGAKMIIGSWVSEAIKEKAERERQTEKMQYDYFGKKLETK